MVAFQNIYVHVIANEEKDFATFAEEERTRIFLNLILRLFPFFGVMANARKKIDIFCFRFCDF